MTVKRLIRILKARRSFLVNCPEMLEVYIFQTYRITNFETPLVAATSLTVKYCL